MAKSTKTVLNTKKNPPKAWLVWIGSEHYTGITDWSDEAVALGVSKRLPNAAMGRALMNPGTVIFVAHDEGETKQCLACGGTIECPECRKLTTEASNLVAAVSKARRDFKGDFDDEAPRGLKRFVEVREAKIQQLSDECKACKSCKGAGTIPAGTGGSVTLKDGRKWDYRAYNYWLHQPKKFSADEVVDRDMCKHCGGTGELPCGRIFGMFVPERIEYILKGDESKEQLEALKGFKLVNGPSLSKESKRKCGVRKVGGVYAVTSTVDSATARAALDKLVKSGVVKPSGADLHGSFVRFHAPVAIDEKRFRGIKQVELKLLGKAAVQAEMVTEALG